MASQLKRSGYLDTEEGEEVKRKLQLMADSSSYSTTSSYSPNTLLYPDNLVSFVDRHMNYLINHPSLNADEYLSNIRLMTQVR